LRLGWLNDSDSCDGGKVAIGGDFNDRSNGDDPDVKGYPGPAVWVWA